MNIARKLSPATLMGDARKRPAPGKTDWWYRVAGRATGSEVGDSSFGEWCVLTGEFVATRFDGGEPTQGGKCFLPCGMAEMISSRIMNAMTENGGQQVAIEFVYDIGAIPSKSQRPEDQLKYEYVIRDALDSGRGSPLHAKLLAAPLPPGIAALPPGAGGASGGTNPLLEGAQPVPPNPDVLGQLKLSPEAAQLKPGQQVLTPADPGHPNYDAGSVVNLVPGQAPVTTQGVAPTTDVSPDAVVVSQPAPVNPAASKQAVPGM